jgi:hypothetical protein
MSLKLASLTLALLGCALLAGCTQVSTTEPRPSRSVNSSVSPNPAPSTSPTPTNLTALTCDSIITSTARVQLNSHGNVPNPDFQEKVRAEGGDLAHLLNFGGVACQWGQDESDATFVLAFAFVTKSQAEQERAYLSANGWASSSQTAGSELWSPTTLDNYLGNVPAYEFRDGTIRYALDAESSFGLFAM